MRAASVVVLLLSVVAVASSGWLLFGHVPAAVDADGKARSETARQQALTDAIAGHALALAVFSRDYGEVQALLTRYAELGYVSRALVTNADRAVVASVGPFPEGEDGAHPPILLEGDAAAGAHSRLGGGRA